MFYITTLAPALVIIILLVVWALKSGKYYWVFGFAVLGCLISAASPWLSNWYAWYVIGDHTPNIGFGLLAIGQPLITPIVAALGALIGIVVETAVMRPNSR